MRKLNALVYDANVKLVDDLRGEIGAACWGEDETDAEGAVLHRFSFERGQESGVFEDVGGVKIWIDMNDTLKAGRMG